MKYDHVDTTIKYSKDVNSFFHLHGEFELKHSTTLSFSLPIKLE